MSMAPKRDRSDDDFASACTGFRGPNHPEERAARGYDEGFKAGLRVNSAIATASDPDQSEGAYDTWNVGELAVVLDRSGAYPDIWIETDQAHKLMTFDRFSAGDLGRALLNAERLASDREQDS